MTATPRRRRRCGSGASTSARPIAAAMPRPRRAVPARRRAGSRRPRGRPRRSSPTSARAAPPPSGRPSARFGGGRPDGRLLLARDELAAAADALGRAERDALETAIANVRRFAETQRPASTRTTIVPGRRARAPLAARRARRRLRPRRLGAVPVVAGHDRRPGAGRRRGRRSSSRRPRTATATVHPVLLGAAGPARRRRAPRRRRRPGDRRARLRPRRTRASSPSTSSSVPGAPGSPPPRSSSSGEVGIDLPAGPSEGLVLADADGRRRRPSPRT